MRKLFGLFFIFGILFVTTGCSDSTKKTTQQVTDATLEYFLRQWGAAVVLSDSTAAPSQLKYNSGETATDYTVNSVTYKLGSINMYNYQLTSGSTVYATGPYFYSILSSIVPALYFYRSIQEAENSALENSIPGKKEITEENERISKLPLTKKTAEEMKVEREIVTANESTLPDTTTLYSFYDDAGKTVNAYYLDSGTVTSNGRTVTVKVYVDSTWYNAETNAATASKALLKKFIGTGNNDSIYEWVTNIYGSEWGTTQYTNLIADDKTITILLFDIDGDGYSGSNGAFTVGFFYNRDNFIKNTASSSAIKYSNEKLMFYIDLPYMLKKDSTETSWTTSGLYPNKIYGTLAHEFQHMIHYYQKNIVYSSQSSTWLNEMCSVTTEDFIAEKMGVEGPRGIANVNSTGSKYITSGRLPYFIYYNDDSLNIWDNGLADYSVVYAFGAYLSRNYGGPDFFKKIVQTSDTDFDAIKNAMSGTTDIEKYGSKTWSVSSKDEVKYLSVSSITITPQAGGNTIYFILSNTNTSASSITVKGGSYGRTEAINAGSNTYFNAGTITTATTYTLSLPTGVFATAVAR